MVFEYTATISNVVDGDTFDFDIDLGFGISYRGRLRLYGVDTPEMRGPEKLEGERVKQYVIGRLFGKQVQLKTKKWKGKYGRFVAEVYVFGKDDDFGVNLAEELIDLGMAKKVDY